MASVYSVEVHDRTYTVVDDRSAGYRVLIHGVIRDECRRYPCAYPVTIGSKNPRMYVKTFPDGLFCLAGDPQRVFPNNSTRDYAVAVTFHASGYRETAGALRYRRASISQLRSLNPSCSAGKWSGCKVRG